jgi:hypothetical protein
MRVVFKNHLENGLRTEVEGLKTQLEFKGAKVFYEYKTSTKTLRPFDSLLYPARRSNLEYLI